MEDFNNRRRDELELREFVKRVNRQEASASGRKSLYMPSKKRRRRRNNITDILTWIGFTVGVLSILTITILGILICKIPAAGVLLTVLLEVALAICLYQDSLFVHSGTVIMNVILGIIFHIIVFMILISLVYLISVVLMNKRAYKVDEYL